MAFEQIVVKSPVTDADLEKYADVVNQQVIVWTECTGPDNTPVQADFDAESASVAVVQVRQAKLVQLLEPKREADGGRADNADGNITRG